MPLAPAAPPAPPIPAASTDPDEPPKEAVADYQLLRALDRSAAADQPTLFQEAVEDL